MTFLDAAIEVLRNSKEPLHFAEIARRAVGGKLLSHVGRDPEAAMQTCLNAAVRRKDDGDEGPIVRARPGYFAIRKGAVLAPPAQPTTSGVKVNESTPTNHGKANDDEGDRHARGRRNEEDSGRGRGPARRRRRGSEPEVAAEPEPEPEPDDVVRDDDDDGAVEFEAPVGSGLEGVTDVALVMANAMSRLVEARPELKSELEALQSANNGAPPPMVSTRAPSAAGPIVEERGGRRRRRRRRRGRRVDWSGPAAGRPTSVLAFALLDGVADVLREAGPKSLHVRQIAEMLAGRGVLGGEISEIERAVTAAILLDVQQHGRASRFAVRGDARYQLQGARLPEAVARAEEALRTAVRDLEHEARNQVEQWLGSLGARALESLARMYLQREGYVLQATLPPSRGLGRLVVDDPEPEYENGRLLVVVAPRRTQIEGKPWDGELERNRCGGVLLFAAGDVSEEIATSEARIVTAADLAAWMLQNGIGVHRLAITVPMLDPLLVESIGGLDT